MARTREDVFQDMIPTLFALKSGMDGGMKIDVVKGGTFHKLLDEFFPLSPEENLKFPQKQG